MTTDERALRPLSRSEHETLVNRTLSRTELLSSVAKPLLTELRSLNRSLREEQIRVLEPCGELQRLDGVLQEGTQPAWQFELQTLAACERIPVLRGPSSRILVVGGGPSLLGCYLASLGHEVHVVELPEKSLSVAQDAARALGPWPAHFHSMEFDKLQFPEQHFDHALSIGVLHHLDFVSKQGTLASIGRCLKPGGLLSITFEYGNPCPFILGCGEDVRLRNRLSTPEDIQRSFLETGIFELEGNPRFQESGEKPFLHLNGQRGVHAFGVLLLRKLTHVQPPHLAAPTPGPSQSARDAASTGETAAKTTSDAAKDVFLSVIVCTYKRPALLRQALTSLIEQKLSSVHFEVIVVDNNSGDETESVVREFTEIAFNIRYVRETKQGLSHSRNRGCDEARGSHVIYIDDDAKAQREYLSLIHLSILRHDPDIMGGPIYPYYTEQKPGWFKDEYEIRRHASETGWSTTCSVSGSSFVIKRELLYSLGKFDPSLGMIGETIRLGEERAVLNCYRLRPVNEQKVYYHLGCIVYHHVPRDKMTPRYLLKRYYVAGHAKAQIEGMTRKRWGPVARTLYILKCWVRRVAGPFTFFKNGMNRGSKQWLLERGATFMFELGRLVGCLPSWKRRPRLKS